MKIGIIDLLFDAPATTALGRLYARYFRKQFMSIAPQAVAVWCRQLGHKVHYATYYGQCDPLQLIPDDADAVFVASYSQASAPAYALAAVVRRRGALTVIGGPHARAFPSDCLRYFDLVVRDCDKNLIADILHGRCGRHSVVTSGRALTEFPSAEERAPEIAVASFHHGRPLLTSVIPMLSSIGCPYNCNFCVDWNSKYVVLPHDRLKADLEFLSRKWPRAIIAYHDPNFAVRFDETMDVIDLIPEDRRNPYAMESSLSILRQSRLPRLRRTNCVYVAPGVESWRDYSNKSGASGMEGRVKLEKVVSHLRMLADYVPGIQANILFGGDSDQGSEPAELTGEFIRRMPQVWPTINIPSPFGGTPLYDQWHVEGRILQAMPFAFYYNPYLAITLKHYDPVAYYDHLIDMHVDLSRHRMLVRRLATQARPAVRFVHGLRTVAARYELAAFRQIREMLCTNARFRAFHEGRTETLPELYHRLFEQRLGRFAELIPRNTRRPILEPPGAVKAAPASRPASSQGPTAH